MASSIRTSELLMRDRGVLEQGHEETARGLVSGLADNLSLLGLGLPLLASSFIRGSMIWETCYKDMFGRNAACLGFAV